MLSFRTLDPEFPIAASVTSTVHAAKEEKPEQVRSFSLTEGIYMKSVRRFARSEDGATAIEYALIASMIAMAIVAGVHGMGTQLSTVFIHIGNAFNSVN